MITIHEQCQIVANRVIAGAVDLDTAIEQIKVIMIGEDVNKIILDFVTLYIQQASRANTAEQAFNMLQGQQTNVLVDKRDLASNLKVANRKLLQIARIAASIIE